MFLCDKLIPDGVTCVFSRIRRVQERRTCLSFAFLPVLVSFSACFGDTRRVFDKNDVVTKSFLVLQLVLAANVSGESVLTG